MSTLQLIAHVVPAADGKPASTLLTLGDGTSRTNKAGETRFNGHTKGSDFWLGLARYVETEGLDMLLYTIFDTFGKPDVETAAPTPPPTVETPAPEPAVPTPVKDVRDLPFYPPSRWTAPIETPAPTLTVQEPKPEAPTPAPVPGVKATHSLDYCPKRLTIKGAIFGLRDGTIYRWTVMYNGQASHWRASRKPGLTPASFETPTVAPTVKPTAPIPAPKPQAPTVRTVPVAQCETLPDGVITVFVQDGVKFTVYAPKAGESFCRTILSKIETPAAK